MKSEITRKFAERETKETVWIDLPRLVTRFTLSEILEGSGTSVLSHITTSDWETITYPSFASVIREYEENAKPQTCDFVIAPPSKEGIVRRNLTSPIIELMPVHSIDNFSQDNFSQQFNSTPNLETVTADDELQGLKTNDDGADIQVDERMTTTEEAEEKWQKWLKICYFLTQLARQCDLKIQEQQESHRKNSSENNNLSLHKPKEQNKMIESLLQQKFDNINKMFILKEIGMSENIYVDALEESDIPALLKSVFENDDMLKHSLLLSILCLCTQNMLFQPVFRINDEILKQKYKLHDFNEGPGWFIDISFLPDFKIQIKHRRKGTVKAHPMEKSQWVVVDWEVAALVCIDRHNLSQSQCVDYVVRCSDLSFFDGSSRVFVREMNELLHRGNFELV